MATESWQREGSRGRRGADSSEPLRLPASRGASPASSQPPRVAFRALRVSEGVGWLRQPPQALRGVDRAGLRAAIVHWVAHGKEGPESPFVHAVVDLEACRRLMSERPTLYQGVIVKIDLSQLPPGGWVDLSTHAAQQKWLQEEPGDSEAFLEDLRATRAYCRKDQQVLIMVPVPDAAISVQERSEGGPRLFVEQAREKVCVWRGHIARVLGDCQRAPGATHFRR